METVITYSLRGEKKRSDQYYQDIFAFTDEVLAEVNAQAGDVLSAFYQFIEVTEREELRSRPEYAFEFLSLGILWDIYLPYALGSAQMPERVLSRLVVLRKKHKSFKPLIDALRGWLGTIFLFSPVDRNASSPELDVESFYRLLAWMKATGDFKEISTRLSAWRNFFAEQDVEQVAGYLRVGLALADWFEARSEQELGEYTVQVDNFLKETHPGYRGREDMIFCGRQRVEYHLNMLGAEILNRAFRGDFIETERKVVLIPPCMKAKAKSDCEAVMTPLGERCMACTPDCRAHQVTKLGEKQGFDVMIMSHELNVFSNSDSKTTASATAKASIGVVGVSCPLTNVTGGWETKKLGVPAQGILLDYCGCPWHWHDDGIMTEINLDQLLRVLDIKK